MAFCIEEHHFNKFYKIKFKCLHQIYYGLKGQNIRHWLMSSLSVFRPPRGLLFFNVSVRKSFPVECEKGQELLVRCMDRKVELKCLKINY